MAHAPSAALTRRHQAIRADLQARTVDALVVFSLPNILYLTNFAGSTAIAVVTRDRLHFLTDSRYLTVVGEMQGTACACPGLELIAVEGSYDARLADLLTTLDTPRVAFEAAHLTVSRHSWLEATLTARAGGRVALVPTEDIVERARGVKDDYETA